MNPCDFLVFLFVLCAAGAFVGTLLGAALALLCDRFHL